MDEDKDGAAGEPKERATEAGDAAVYDDKEKAERERRRALRQKWENTPYPYHDPDQGIAYRDAPPDRDVILHLVEELLDLERGNNPRVYGPFLKGPRARRALNLSGELLGHTIRWAGRFLREVRQVRG